jgi:hypothetical protein
MARLFEGGFRAAGCRPYGAALVGFKISQIRADVKKYRDFK